jgi:hypothetical protein
MHEAPSEKGNGEADAQHGGKLEASLFIEGHPNQVCGDGEQNEYKRSA